VPIAIIPSLVDRLANDSECLLANFAIRHDVIGVVQVPLVDLYLRDEFIHLNDPLALDSNRFQLFRIHLKVLICFDRRRLMCRATLPPWTSFRRANARTMVVELRAQGAALALARMS
jgi:hypothetical protein